MKYDTSSRPQIALFCFSQGSPHGSPVSPRVSPGFSQGSSKGDLGPRVSQWGPEPCQPIKVKPLSAIMQKFPGNVDFTRCF